MKHLLTTILLFVTLQVNSQNSNPPLPTEDSVYELIQVNEKPKFPGGDLAIIKYLNEKKGYPAMARELGLEGTIIISFIIEKNGDISKVEAILDQTADGGLKEAAIKAVQSMNDMRDRWTPGKIKGVAVRTKFKVPLRFKLS